MHLLTLLTTTLLTTLPLAHSSPLRRSCQNHLINPSFESGLSPYLVIVSSAWGDRGPLASSGHTSPTSYHAYSPSTMSSSLSISQSSVGAPVGATVECAAWVKSRRSVGETRVEVFLDGVSCGVGRLGAQDDEWVRVGGSVKVLGGVGGSTFAIVLGSEVAGEDGWEVWVDELVVGEGC